MAKRDARASAAASEARSLWRLVQTGSSTVEAVRKLVSVSAEDEKLLRAFAKTDPVVCRWVTMALAHRQTVLREFDRLAAADAPLHHAGR